MKTTKRAQIEAELRQISKSHDGLLNPVDVVAFARNKSTALHSQFEWDNRKAGEAYRLEQARHLIRVHVTVIEGSNKPVRVWASLPKDRNATGGYRTMVDVLSDADHRAQLLDCALKELEVFRQKYAAIKELADVFNAIKVVAKRRRSVA